MHCGVWNTFMSKTYDNSSTNAKREQEAPRAEVPALHTRWHTLQAALRQTVTLEKDSLTPQNRRQPHTSEQKLCW